MVTTMKTISQPPLKRKSRQSKRFGLPPQNAYENLEGRIWRCSTLTINPKERANHLFICGWALGPLPPLWEESQRISHQPQQPFFAPSLEGINPTFWEPMANIRTYAHTHIYVHKYSTSYLGTVKAWQGHLHYHICMWACLVMSTTYNRWFATLYIPVPKGLLKRLHISEHNYELKNHTSLCDFSKSQTTWATGGGGGGSAFAARLQYPRLQVGWGKGKQISEGLLVAKAASRYKTSAQGRWHTSF